MVVFFFKQKTAYERRISDWSSDVCSSDLQVGGPVEAAMAQPRTGEAGSAGLRQHAVNVALVLRSGCARERERGRPQIKVEQAIAEARLVVVVALGLGGGDALDLPAVEAEALIDRANLRFGRLRVGLENP